MYIVDFFFFCEIADTFLFYIYIEEPRLTVTHGTGGLTDNRKDSKTRN